ncbi:hypothetical protein LRAMOSA05496 [Lichtheimia ramosa]|uniref:Uncharacterized protein n=1 Tax=Lichtheimia ramosa TaxID=688394 RepID=A0A077X2P4_9FUNG|nr:hypothetical protein LRAMOSA05496 [Lichtheimia ramosa]
MSLFAPLPSQRRPSVDIRGQSVNSDIMVALLDRPGEMHALTARNTHFYTALKNYITETQGADAWLRFQEIVYAPREEIPDREWMNAISTFLSHNPVFLSKFKESVGYEDDDDDNSQEEDELSPLPSPRHEDTMMPPERRRSRQSSGGSRMIPTHACLLALRDYPNIQARLPLMCPAYFRKARQLMSLAPSASRSNAVRRNSILEEDVMEDATGADDEQRFNMCDQESEGPYENFCQVVCTTRQEQPDDEAWLDAIVESLDGWPQLLNDLEQIAMSLDENEEQGSPDAYI